MNLIIDQGNTATKIAFLEKGELIKKITFLRNKVTETNRWLAQNVGKNTPILISSVTNEVLQVPSQSIVRLNYETRIPIQNEYATPMTLGNDRLANAVAIARLSNELPALAIDLGTCIKYDLVVNQTYIGGNISPGLNMRFDALHQLTDQLPRITADQNMFEAGSRDYGITTETSILNGVQQAIVHEINGFVDRYSREFEGLTIFMTGGDAKFFDRTFKKGIFAFSVKYLENLTLFGLNEILEYNVKS